MIVTMVHIWVNTGHLDEFIKASIENHENTIQEPGNLRFDILRDSSDPSKFVFYEVFESEEAVKYHKTTKHYNQWKDRVAGWMVNPREGVRYEVLAPTANESW